MKLNIDHLPAVLLMALIAVLCAAVALYSLKIRQKVARANSFAFMALSAMIWMLATGIEMLFNDVIWKLTWWPIISFGILSCMTGQFLFALQYSLHVKKIPTWLYVFFGSILAAFPAFALTNSYHHLLYVVQNISGSLAPVNGPIANGLLGYVYLMGLLSLLLLSRAFITYEETFRYQTGLLIIGTTIPIAIGIATDLFHWDPIPNFDEAAFSLVFTVLIYSLVTFRYRIFDPLPLAYNLIVNTMQDGVMVIDLENQVVFSNPAANRLFSDTAAPLTGQDVGTLLAHWQPEAQEAWKSGKKEFQVAHGSDPWQHYRLIVSTLSDKPGRAAGYLLTIYDISDRERLTYHLQQMAISDPLTGCFNRRFFFEAAELALLDTRIGGKPLAIAMIDLDHFKLINDAFGHSEGDRVLQELANICRKVIRKTDIFARFGGEEFVLLMPATSPEEAVAVVERLRQAIRNNAFSGQRANLTVTASIGVAVMLPEDQASIDVLLNRADQAMYRSKQVGRDCTTLWDASSLNSATAANLN